MNVIDLTRAALIVIDVQPDFLPGGALACHGGDAVIAGIERALQARRFGHVVATQDGHPPGHVSFASSHAGHAPFDVIELYGQPQTLWPDHCVQGTDGAALHPAVDWSSVDLVLRKGTDPRVDSYSAFRENHGPLGTRPPTGLAGWLRERSVEEVFLCGLARDVCVLWSALDAREHGLRTHVLWDLTRPVTPDNDAPTRETLSRHAISVCGQAELGL